MESFGNQLFYKELPMSYEESCFWQTRLFDDTCARHKTAVALILSEQFGGRNWIASQSSSIEMVTYTTFTVTTIYKINSPFSWLIEVYLPHSCVLLNLSNLFFNNNTLIKKTECTQWKPFEVDWTCFEFLIQAVDTTGILYQEHSRVIKEPWQ
jgi:hypothetical protein